MQFLTLLGLFKPNIAPAIVDQYRHQQPYTKILKSGEKVVVDPETTIQRIMLVFCGLINVGCFFAITTTYAEKRVGYWLAFLLLGIVYFFVLLLLIFMRNRLITMPLDALELRNVFKIILVAIKQNKARFWGAGFCYVTAYELAYARSPKSMRGLVTALLLFSNALLSALSLAITPGITDPYLVWVWAVPAVALFVQTCFFHWRYRHMNDDEFMS